ncbi:MAG: SDR family NAD(P)-dependent oxidoreductase, partial [Candidatus Hydromicrobium sp.]
MTKSNDKKSAVVTGGAGFIGSHICDYLLEKEFRVICIDNLITGSLANIEHINSKDFVFINHDITEFIKVDEDVDYI